MASVAESPRSGRFVLRMPPALHGALQQAARETGLSLNAYCVRRLAAAGSGAAGDEDVAALLARARTVAGDALKAVVLHGSWVRGEAASASDVDALVVVEPRVALTRALYRAWDAAPVTWRGRSVDPHFVHRAVDGKISALWAEAALDGVVLFERDWEMSAYLAGVRHAIAGGRLVRRVVHGQPYWTERA